MPESRTDTPIKLDEQRQFWNSWNAEHRTGGRSLPNVNARQAHMVQQWLAGLGRTDLDILEVGCGSGWLSGQLVRFGNVTATDLADEVLPKGSGAPPGVRFVAGDFFNLDLPSSAYDVIVSLEMLAHVQDQAAFLAKIAHLLRPDGLLMLATQNRYVLERWSDVAPKGAGQIRKWTNARELARLLRPCFSIERMTSIVPVGDRGLLRWTNSPRVSRLLSAMLSKERVAHLKERLFLGHTLMVLARKLSKKVPG
jgi:2-polyprenyl-3-methyl-5-hydroxy-6-metoxy-1,4-benzoquinol methylase